MDGNNGNNQGNQYNQYDPYNQNSQYGSYNQGNQINPDGQRQYSGYGQQGQSAPYGTDPNAQYGSYQDYTANIPPYQPSREEPVNTSSNGLQVAGLVCGILGICSSCCYGIPGIIFGIAGLICSVIGNKRSKHGIGIAGLICSIIAIICGVIMTIVYIAVIWKILEEGGYPYYYYY